MIIVDLRSAEEYAKCHLCDALNIPTHAPPLSACHLIDLQNSLSRMFLRTERSALIGFYCKKGIRSTAAVTMLRDMGFCNVINLGGMCAAGDEQCGCR